MHRKRLKFLVVTVVPPLPYLTENFRRQPLGCLQAPALTSPQQPQPRSQGFIRTTLAQSSDSSILIGRQFLYRTPTNS